jgi:hypothetical protein
MRPKGAIIGCLSLLLIAAGIIGVGRQGNLWNDWIMGVIVAVLGFALARIAPVHGIVSGILGLWLIISAFLPDLQVRPGAWWNDIIVGVILAIAGFSTRRIRAESISDIEKAA